MAPTPNDVFVPKVARFLVPRAIFVRLCWRREIWCFRLKSQMGDTDCVLAVSVLSITFERKTLAISIKKTEKLAERRFEWALYKKDCVNRLEMGARDIYFDIYFLSIFDQYLGVSTSIITFERRTLANFCKKILKARKKTVRMVHTLRGLHISTLIWCVYRFRHG